MQPRPSWRIGFAATLLVTACSTAPAIAPSPAPEYQPPLGMTGPNITPPAQPETTIPDPEPSVIPIKTAPQDTQVPACPVTVGNNGLMDPQGNVMNPQVMQENLPAFIPQQNAGDYLQQLPGTLVNPYNNMGNPYPGYQYGCIPNLLQYGALSNCLYYNYNNFWVPYTLYGGCYYPYSYAPYYDAMYTGYYAYPWFYSYGDYVYPYYYLSNDYCYGYPDCEYNWSSYRERNNHRYDDDRARDDRGRDRNFQNWRDQRLNQETPQGGDLRERTSQYFQRFQERRSNQKGYRPVENRQGNSQGTWRQENNNQGRIERKKDNGDAPRVRQDNQKEYRDRQERKEIRNQPKEFRNSQGEKKVTKRNSGNQNATRGGKKGRRTNSEDLNPVTEFLLDEDSGEN